MCASRIRPRNKSATNAARVGRNRGGPVRWLPESRREGISLAGRTGAPSTRTTWHPVPNVGRFDVEWAAAAACCAVAIKVDEVSTPAACSSRTAWFTPSVNPRSSAFTIRRFTQASVPTGNWGDIASRESQREDLIEYPCCCALKVPGRDVERSPGRLAQLVRAPALQAGCRGFESLTAHQFFSSRAVL